MGDTCKCIVVIECDSVVLVDWSNAQNLCEYLAPYAEESLKKHLENEGCDIAFFPYDWALNAMDNSAVSPQEAESVKSSGRGVP